MKTLYLITISIISILLISCGKDYSPEEQAYVDKVLLKRAEKAEYMKNDESSPFNRDENVNFTSLKYFDVNPAFRFESKLFEYESKDTVTVMGTKGEERRIVRYGYVTFSYEEKEYKINVYQGESRSGDKYYSIWFTDLTTGDDTYGVGRYLNFEKEENSDHLYVIDFNMAYNPYCAYTPIYSCAIPLDEDHIPIAIKAGEKNYH